MKVWKEGVRASKHVSFLCGGLCQPPLQTSRPLNCQNHTGVQARFKRGQCGSLKGVEVYDLHFVDSRTCPIRKGAPQNSVFQVWPFSLQAPVDFLPPPPSLAQSSRPSPRDPFRGSFSARFRLVFGALCREPKNCAKLRFRLVFGSFSPRFRLVFGSFSARFRLVFGSFLARFFPRGILSPSFEARLRRFSGRLGELCAGQYLENLLLGGHVSMATAKQMRMLGAPFYGRGSHLGTVTGSFLSFLCFCSLEVS